MEGIGIMAEPDTQTRVDPPDWVDPRSTIHVLTRAFAADPAARWVYPGEDQHWQHFPQSIRALGGKSFEQGTAFLSPGGVGAALCLPPGVYPDDDAMISVIGSSVSGAKRHELFTMMEEMRRCHHRRRRPSMRSTPPRSPRPVMDSAITWVRQSSARSARGRFGTTSAG